MFADPIAKCVHIVQKEMGKLPGNMLSERTFGDAYPEQAIPYRRPPITPKPMKEGCHELTHPAVAATTERHQEEDNEIEA